MLPLLLAVFLTVSFQEDVVTLKHGVKYETTLGPDDPVLEGFGPSKTFRYELEADDSVLFIWATSNEADLVMRAKFEGGRALKPSGAADLFAGVNSIETLEDDDSGGGTTPFLGLERKGGGMLAITVAAKRPSSLANETPLTVHCFEARETAATRAAAAACKAAIQKAGGHAQSGNLDQARATLAEALERTLETEGAGLSDTIHQAAWSLGFVSYRLSDLPTTRDAQAWTRDFRYRTLPEDHPDLQEARGNLALTIRLLGDLPGARELQERVLEVRSRTLPEEHPNLQTARGNLATTKAALGDLEGARGLLELVLQVFSRTLPDDHPHLQAARGNLAATIQALGDLEGARALLERVLEVRSRTLPEDHPELLSVRENLASTIQALGDLNGARVLQEHVLKVYSRTLPENHPNLQRARLNLASTIQALGDHEGARALLERVLVIYSRTLPEDHPHLQAARLNLALTIQALGDLEAACTLEERVLEVYSRTLPGDHRDLQAARMNLAATIQALGDLEGARTLQERVLEEFSLTLPDEHPSIQSARGNLAATMFELGNFQGARALQERVLKVRSRTLPEDHSDLQRTRSHLALTIRALGDLEGARTLQERVLEEFSRTLPDEHPSLQSARGNLAATIQALGHLEAARALEERVLEVRSRTLPENHPDLQAARANLARSRAALGEAEKGRELVRDLASTTIRWSRSLDYISERQLASEWVLSTVLSIVSGAGAFESDPAGELLAFSMCEAIRGAAMTAARLEQGLAGDAEAADLRVALARSGRKLNELAGSRSADISEFTDFARERDRLRRELLSRIEKTGADRLLPSLEVEAIRSRLAPDEAAVGYWRYHRWQIDPETRKGSTTPSYLAWVLTSADFRRIELGPAGEIEDAIENRRRDLGAPSRGITGVEPLAARMKERGELVRRQIFDPIRESLGTAKRVWIAPADAMHLVPFDALPQDDGVIGDDFEIVHVQALSELTLDAPSSLPSPSVLAMGGIHYDEEADAFNPEEDSRSISRGASRSALNGGSGKASEWKFGRLPGTLGEVEAVGEYFLDAFADAEVPDPLILTRSKASRDAFETLAPKRRYLHLATHGWFAPESVASTADDRVIDREMGVMSSSLRDQVIGLAPSLLCGLAFAGANGEADMYGRVRGVITAEEISAMDLTGVELCVLSACETNVGVRRVGQGIASLKTALHAAGARTAITSLWKVPDEATRELMTEFYRRLWVLKEPKAKALWNAKKKLHEQLDADGNPVYTIRDWAGWVISGDPD